MGRKCPLCQNSPHQDSIFFPIPYGNPELLERWCIALGINLKLKYYSHVCKRHFDDDDLDQNYACRLRLHPKKAGHPKLKANAVPHLHITFSVREARPPAPPRDEVVRRAHRLEELVVSRRSSVGDGIAATSDCMDFNMRNQLPHAINTQPHHTLSSSVGVCDLTGAPGLVPPLFRPAAVAAASLQPQNHGQNIMLRVIAPKPPKPPVVFTINPQENAKSSSVMSLQRRWCPITPKTMPGQLHALTRSVSVATPTTFTATTTSCSNLQYRVATSAPLLQLYPQTAQERQILQDAEAIALAYNIPTSLLLTPPRCTVSVASSTPVSATNEIPTFNESPIQPGKAATKKRRLEYDDELINQELQKSRIDSLDCEETEDGHDQQLLNANERDETWAPNESSLNELSVEENTFMEKQPEDNFIGCPGNDMCDIESDNSDKEPDLCFVSMKNLMALFETCKKCQGPNMVKKFRTGAHIRVECHCPNGHKVDWTNHEIYDKKPVINVLLATALYSTGHNFAPFARFAKSAKIAFFGPKTHYKIVSRYLKPVLTHEWARNRQERLAKIKNENRTIKVNGDARFDSRGKSSAKNGTYTLMDAASNEILDFCIYQKGLAPGELESKAMMVVFTRLINEVGADLVQAFCTDRNYIVGKKMKDNFPMIYHAFDVWHVSKGLSKALGKLSKAKKNSNIAGWIKSITNHVWYCAEHCNESEVELIEKWNSLLHHIQNEHTWTDKNGVRRQCDHAEIPEEEAKWKNWLNQEEVASLKKVAFNTRVMNQLKKCCLFLHTGGLESYHSLYLHYASKETQYTFEGMTLRTILAVLDHNNNIGRPQIGWKRVFSQPKKEWVAKSVFEPKDDSWRTKLIADVVKFATTEPNMIEFDPRVDELLFPYDLPKNIYGTEKPSIDTLLQNRQRRNRAK